MNVLKFLKTALWTIFPPERPVERVIRAQYHRVTSAKWYVNRVIQKSKESYQKWLIYQENHLAASNEKVVEGPLISFFVSIEDSQSKVFQQTVESLKAQVIGNWEAIVFFSPQVTLTKAFLDPFTQENRVVFVEAEANNLSSLLKLSHGNYFVCCISGDQFNPHFIQQVYQSINQNKEAALYYCDCEEQSEIDSSLIPFFKPTAYSPELHLSINYLSRSVVCKSLALPLLKKVDPAFGFLDQEWELQFLLFEKNFSVVHIPHILVHQQRANQESTENKELLIGTHLNRLGIPAPIQVDFKENARIRWDFGQPSVSIIIPSKNNFKVLKNLLDSLFEKTAYRNFEVIIVDNGSNEEAVLEYYAEIEKKHPVKVIPFNEPFNYSKANNLGAANSKSEYLLFMNNDMEVIHPDWLTELVQWATVPEIGIVGTKLIHQDTSIQHAGIVLGLQGFVGHLYLNTPDHYSGLLGSVDWYRNVSAVTGACQMMRKSTFLELGGFDEGFQLVFSDVYLCLLAIKKGYRILYTPNAALKHLEGNSRGFQSPRLDMLRGFDILQEWVIRDDPYFSPNLTYTTIPLCQLDYHNQSQRLAEINERRKFLLKE